MTETVKQVYQVDIYPGGVDSDSKQTKLFERQQDADAFCTLHPEGTPVMNVIVTMGKTAFYHYVPTDNDTTVFLNQHPYARCKPIELIVNS